MFISLKREHHSIQSKRWVTETNNKRTKFASKTNPSHMKEKSVFISACLYPKIIYFAILGNDLRKFSPSN